MKKGLVMAALSLLLVAPAAVMAAGADDYNTKGCGACHGADGTKAQGAIPKLAGKPAAALAEKLKGYRDGTVKTPMAGLMSNNAKVKSLTDAEIDGIAQWLGSK